MIKNYKSKDMQAGGDKPTRLKCVTECWAPGVGAFKAGDIIEDAEIVRQMAGNPNFQEITEEA